MTTTNNIKFSLFEKSIWIATILFLLASWIYTIISYSNLPETIAVHFNGAGKADGYGSKNTIWLAPIIFTLLIWFLLYGSKKPKNFDLSNKITTSKQAIASARTLLLSALLLSIVLFLVVFSMVNASVDTHTNYKWVFPTLIGVFITFSIATITIDFKAKNSDNG